MKRLVIDRTTWLRGDSKNSSLLRTEDGKMCCLGFCALQAGFTPEQIEDKPEPTGVSTIDDPDDLWPDGILERIEDTDPETDELVVEYCTTLVTDELMATNDNENLLDSEREKKITSLFASIGITAEFVN